MAIWGHNCQLLTCLLHPSSSSQKRGDPRASCGPCHSQPAGLLIIKYHSPPSHNFANRLCLTFEITIHFTLDLRVTGHPVFPLSLARACPSEHLHAHMQAFPLQSHLSPHRASPRHLNDIGLSSLCPLPIISVGVSTFIPPTAMQDLPSAMHTQSGGMPSWGTSLLPWA